MAGWDGAGNFVRNYNWVTDAANGIKILASKMDTEFNTVATGLMNCLTKDNQTKPTTNYDWGGYKITNLAPGVASTDAATVGQIIANEWYPESNAYAWVAATQIKITGVDVTATYHVGRRIKFKDNGVQQYATITASAFGTDTTLTLVLDSGTAMVGPTTVLYYGIVSYVNRSYFDPRTIVSAYASADQAIATTGVKTLVTLGNEVLDSLSEMSSSRVTVKYPGVYFASGQVEFRHVSAGNSASAEICKNTNMVARYYSAPQSGLNAFGHPVSALVSCVAGDIIDLRFTNYSVTGTITGGADPILGTFLHVVRIL